MVSGTKDRGKRLAGVIIAVSVFLLYARTLGYPLLIGDDNHNIRYNPFYHPLTVSNLAGAWMRPYLDLYIPVTLTVWGIIGGVSKVLPFLQRSMLLHAANIVVHTCCATIAFGFIRDLLNERSRDRESPVAIGLAALFGALVFALHPMQVKNVAWVTGMKDQLGTLFSLLCLQSFHGSGVRLENVESRGGSEVVLSLSGLRRYGAAAAWFSLAVLSKPSSVVLPALAVVLHWSASRSWRGAAILTVPWILISLAISAWTYHMQGNIGSAAVPYPLRVPSALDNLAFYLGKVVFPRGVAHEITRHALQRSGTPAFWVAAAAMAALLIAAYVLGRKRHRLEAGGLAFFAIGLTPILGLVSYGHQTFSEVATHYVSLPLFGIGLSAAALCLEASRRKKGVVLAVLAISVLWLGGLAWVTSRRISDYSCDDTHLGRILALEPDNLWATTDYSYSYVRRGRYAEAADWARRALALNPYDAEARERAAAMLVVGGRFDDAIRMLEHETEGATPLKAARYRMMAGYGKIFAGRIEDGVRDVEAAGAVAPTIVAVGNGFMGSVINEAAYFNERDRIFRERLRQASRIDPSLRALRSLAFAPRVDPAEM